MNAVGETVWEWHADEHMQIENNPNCPLCSRVEWAHPNSIWPLENGDVLVSWRHNHLIAVIDRNSKKLKWEWCDPILGHQHNFQARDNGNYMVFANGVHAPASYNHSPVIEFDPKTKETIWEYISPFFVSDIPDRRESGSNSVFRVYRYQAEGPEIQGRLR